MKRFHLLPTPPNPQLQMVNIIKYDTGQNDQSSRKKVAENGNENDADDKYSIKKRTELPETEKKILNNLF